MSEECCLSRVVVGLWLVTYAMAELSSFLSQRKAQSLLCGVYSLKWQEECLALGQSANKTVLTTGYGLSYQNRCAYFFLVLLTSFSALSTCSFQQKSSCSDVKLSVLFLTNCCKSGFPVSWAVLPRGDPGKEVFSEMPIVSLLYWLKFLLIAVCVSD